MGRLSVTLLAVALVPGCTGEIYVRDGVTDGDTFYLSQRALSDNDPVLQSWVAYSLLLAACKLEIGGENPARASSFDCELTARRHLAEAWRERRGGGAGDEYLDVLAAVEAAGWLPEYVADYYRRPGWQVPDDVDIRAFRHWRRRHYPDHRPETRLAGSWNYARNVREVP